MKTQLAPRYYLYRKTLAYLLAHRHAHYDVNEHGSLCQIFFWMQLPQEGIGDDRLFYCQPEVIEAYKFTFPHHLLTPNTPDPTHFDGLWWPSIDYHSRVRFIRFVLRIYEQKLGIGKDCFLRGKVCTCGFPLNPAFCSYLPLPF